MKQAKLCCKQFKKYVGKHVNPPLNKTHDIILKFIWYVLKDTYSEFVIDHIRSSSVFRYELYIDAINLMDHVERLIYFTAISITLPK